MKVHISPLSMIFGASFVAATAAHNGPFRVVAVAVFLATGLAITAIVYRRGGTQ